MKKITAILSLVAIVASALFVTSCAQKKEPTLVPAFPYNKTATYSQNEDTGEYKWTWASADGFTNAKGVGFQFAKFDGTTLEYRMTPNAEWTAKVVGQGRAYIQIGQGYGFADENYTWGETASGDRGTNALYFKVIKTPESYEEAIEVEVALSMCEQEMVVATLVIEPQIY